MEHQPIDLAVAAAMFATIAAGGVTPLARMPWNTAENIKRVLDCGAHGIVVPMVNTRAEAEAAVAAAKYPPQGIRSVGGAMHAMNFRTDPPPTTPAPTTRFWSCSRRRARKAWPTPMRS